MKKLIAVVTLVMALFAGGAGVTEATVIVKDTFTSATSVDIAIAGRPPETNLPNTTWQKTSSQNSLASTGSPGTGNPAPGVWGLGQASDAVSLADYGSYTKPTLLRISVDLSPETVQGSASGGRGVALGFYSALDGSLSQNRFTGLVLDAAGNLNLVQDPNATGFFDPGSHFGTPVGYGGGTWDANAFYTLSFDINTGTGHITDISLSGSTADYSGFSSTTLFTDAATAYAGLYVSSETGSPVDAFDNFQVESIVPEPSVVVLLGMGGLLSWRRRRK